MILGNLLLALAWAGLNGQFTLGSLVTGAVLGRVILMVLARGDVLPMREVGRVRTLRCRCWRICSGRLLLANFRIARMC